MPVIIDEVRGEVVSDRGANQDAPRAQAVPPKPPPEVEIEEQLRRMRLEEQRVRRLRAD